MKTKTIQSITGFPFVSHVNQDARPTITNEIINKIFGGGYHSNFHDVSRSGTLKIMGYKYNLRPFLKLYLVKQYGSWSEYYAPNKTTLRKCLHGAIEKINEINN
jgi:hypothetical protein